MIGLVVRYGAHIITVQFKYMRHGNIDFSQIISNEARANARYYTLIEEYATTFYLDDIQEIKEFPKNIAYPPVLLLSSLLLLQS